MNYRLILSLLLMVCVGALSVRADESYHPSRIIIKFKKDPNSSTLSSFMKRNQMGEGRRLLPGRYFRFSLKKGMKIDDALKKVIKDQLVEYAEPDYIRYASISDPLYPEQWSLQKINVQSCWQTQKGRSDVVVAIVDSGIDLDHPDLSHQLWINKRETPGNGADDDGNGYVDDYYGYDFAGDRLFPMPWSGDGNPNDETGEHGTHVAGVVAAQQGNYEGISGIAPGVRLMAVKVLSSLGSGYSSDIAEGIKYAVKGGAKVINLSLGAPYESRVEYDAVKYAWDNNVLVVCAAGNGGRVINPIEYPAALPFTMSVGATDSSDQIADFSTHNAYVEVSAPGVEIISTIPPKTYAKAGWSGTSMAAPHVCGLAALIYSEYPGIKNWQVRLMLNQSSLDRGTTGWDPYYGYGRVNATTLLQTPITSGRMLNVIMPANGVIYSENSPIWFIWNPVDGASSYRIEVSRIGKGTATYTTSEPFYAYLSLRWKTPGSYEANVQALNGNGSVISSDRLTFTVSSVSLELERLLNREKRIDSRALRVRMFKKR